MQECGPAYSNMSLCSLWLLHRLDRPECCLSFQAFWYLPSFESLKDPTDPEEVLKDRILRERELMHMESGNLTLGSLRHLSDQLRAMPAKIVELSQMPLLPNLEDLAIGIQNKDTNIELDILCFGKYKKLYIPEVLAGVLSPLIDTFMTLKTWPHN